MCVCVCLRGQLAGFTDLAGIGNHGDVCVGDVDDEADYDVDHELFYLKVCGCVRYCYVRRCDYVFQLLIIISIASPIVYNTYIYIYINIRYIP